MTYQGEGVMSSSAGSAGVVALARGLSILQCFDRPGAELTVSEIARRVELSQPTTWRLCSTLIATGFLVKSGGGAALRVGAPALTLGYAAIHGQDLPTLARPYMDQLSAQVRTSVSLSLYNGVEVISVSQTTGNFIATGTPIGWRASPASSPSGLAILAALPFDEREAALEVIAARDTEAWPRRKARIERALAQYESLGYVTFTGMFDGQYAGAAVALIEGQNGAKRYWGVGCSGLSTVWTAETLAPVAEDLKRIRNLLQPAAKVLSISSV
jgi:DNA-binding IclR family transcriptional regulator